MEPTTSELILSIVKDIQGQLNDMDKRLSAVEKQKTVSDEILDPCTYVIYCAGKEMESGLFAQAMIHVLPTSKMSGERKTLTDASLIAGSELESSVISLGSAMIPVTMQRPDKLTIRLGNKQLVSLLNNGASVMSIEEAKKLHLLLEDLELFRQSYGIEIKTELIDEENDGFWRELQTLLYTAEKEYTKTSSADACQKEKDNVRSTGDSKDS